MQNLLLITLLMIAANFGMLLEKNSYPRKIFRQNQETRQNIGIGHRYIE